MYSPKNIRIEDYNYALPEEKIALYPLSERDMSKLLVYRHGQISETVFRSIADEIPENALLVFNDTKVIHARIVTHTPTGARIEIFCLEPIEPVDVQLAFQQKNRCVWKCLVGGNKKWKNGELGITNYELGIRNKVVMSSEARRACEVETSPCYELRIKRGVAIEDAWEIVFEWDMDLTFAEILETVGKIPLPPYIHREVEESDEERYQTIFAKIKGSVAAPTASLHFSENVLKSLEKKGIETATLTLHVGAGTFKPVTTATIGDHVMHNEKVIVPQECLQKILKAKAENRPIIPVGTTSLRSLESLYWLKPNTHHVEQWAPYMMENGEWRTAKPSTKLMENVAHALSQLAQHNSQFSILNSQFSTSLMIVPGYKFRIATGIITNFHQPKSTLLLLISAMVGEDWRKIYDYALSHDFRFLSYGDSGLLFMSDE